MKDIWPRPMESVQGLPAALGVTSNDLRALTPALAPSRSPQLPPLHSSSCICSAETHTASTHISLPSHGEHRPSSPLLLHKPHPSLLPGSVAGNFTPVRHLSSAAPQPSTHESPPDPTPGSYPPVSLSHWTVIPASAETGDLSLYSQQLAQHLAPTKLNEQAPQRI